MLPRPVIPPRKPARPSRASAAGLAALLCLACGAADEGSHAPRARPNVVLLVSDDHDYELLGFAGHPRAATPTLDRLAAEGATFPLAHAQPRCRAALGTLLTGREPHASGLVYNAGPRRDLGPETLPRLFSAAGYATFAAGKFWEGHPTEEGFDDAPAREDGEVGGVRTRGFVREDQRFLARFLDRLEGRPFFVWWAPMLPHRPHEPPADLVARFPPEDVPVPAWLDPRRASEYREREATSLAMVAWLDRGVARLLELLRQRGLADDTLLCFLIDNGWANGLPSKGTPYEKGVRTPIVLHHPASIPGGVRFDALASILDVPPTLLELAGIPVPSAFQGASLRPWIEGHTPPWRDALCGAAYPVRPTRLEGDPAGDAFAIWARDERFHYVRWLADVRAEEDAHWRLKHFCAPYPEHDAGEEELFDLPGDPYQLENVAGNPERADDLARLRNAAVRWWSATGGEPLPR